MQLKTAEQKITFLGTVIWFLGALFYLYEFFLRTFVGTVAHQIIPDLNLDAEKFALIGSAYYIAYAFMQIPVGILVDKFGVKKILIFATLICALATFLFTRSTGFGTAVAGRFFMGFGSSFAFVCLLIIASTWFPQKYFGFFAGASQFIGTMGPFLAAGPLVSLLSALHGNWRIALNDIGMFGVLLALLCFLIVRNKPRGGEQTLLYLSHKVPLKTRLKRLARNKQAWVIGFYSATVYVSIALMAAVWGTEYLQARGLSQTTAAYMISLAWVGYAIACPVIGGISDFIKRRKPFLVLSAVFGLVSTFFIVYANIHQVWIYAILFFMLGIAASGQNIGFAAITEHSDLSTKASALGLNNGMITLSGAIVPPIVSLFIGGMAKGEAAHLSSSDFIVGLSVMPIVYLAAILICVFLFKETYCKPQKSMIILDY